MMKIGSYGNHVVKGEGFEKEEELVTSPEK